MCSFTKLLLFFMWYKRCLSSQLEMVYNSHNKLPIIQSGNIASYSRIASKLEYVLYYFNFLVGFWPCKKILLLIKGQLLGSWILLLSFSSIFVYLVSLTESRGKNISFLQQCAMIWFFLCWNMRLMIVFYKHS